MAIHTYDSTADELCARLSQEKLGRCGCLDCIAKACEIATEHVAAATASIRADKMNGSALYRLCELNSRAFYAVRFAGQCAVASDCSYWVDRLVRTALDQEQQASLLEYVKSKTGGF